jgi:hypothetical protein
MPQEAIVRVVLQGSGGAGGGPPGGGGTPTPGGGGGGGGGGGTPPLTPVQEAWQRYMRQVREAQVQNILDLIMNRQPPEVKPAENIPTVLKATFGDKLKAFMDKGGFGKLLGAVGGEIGGAAGGALGAIGAAAGPAAIAAAVLIGLKALSNQINQTIRALGMFGSQLISPSADPSQYVGDIGNAMSAFSDKIFYVSPLLGMLGGAAGATAESLSKLMASVDGLVERYRQFSPGIATAQAGAEVRQLLGDLRRAQEATPALMRYIKARSDLQQRIEDTKIRILTRLEPLITDGMRIMSTTVVPFTEINVKLGTSIVEWLTYGVRAFLRWAKIQEEKQDEDALPLLREDIFNTLGAWAHFDLPEGAATNPLGR